jgi:hypothetical protein
MMKKIRVTYQDNDSENKGVHSDTCDFRSAKNGSRLIDDFTIDFLKNHDNVFLFNVEVVESQS